MELPQNQLKFIFQKHKIEYIKKLGSGGFGTVYLGNSISQEFLPLAVKCITRKLLNKKPSLQKYLNQQINSMYSLRHANIVKLLKTFVESESIFLVMQYCQYGNLYSYQYSMTDKVFKLQEASTVFMQILRGLRAIHQENIIHRDLKCENILLKKIPKQQAYICKIGDFGFAKELSQTAKSHCGTPNFMAPQILADKAYDKCVDIWAVGVIFYYMLFGDYPFKGLNILNDIETKCSQGYDLLRQLNPQLIRKRNKSLREKELNILRHFFSNVFVIDPKKRMTILEMSKHPIFKECQLGLEQEGESTNQSSESIQEQRMFSIKKTEFIEDVEATIKGREILNKENTLLMRYFFKKISLCILNVAMKDIDFTEDKGFKNLYSQKIEEILEEYKTVKNELQKMVANKVVFGVGVTSNHLNSPFQKFQYFKDAYRTFLGYIFTQVHSCPIKERQRLKIKVLCCHTINRVFQDRDAKYFQFFNGWLTLKKEKKAKGLFNFQMFVRWIAEDSQQNISKTIAAINQHYYSKK